MNYPVSQADDITLFNTTIVPAGEDQEPMIEQTNEIVHKFNSIYADVLKPVKIITPDSNHAARLPGIDGNAKMGKSLNNCIYLKDSADTVAARVKTMFTDPNHLRVEDPGNTKDNPVFIYLEVLYNSLLRQDNPIFRVIKIIVVIPNDIIIDSTKE